MSRVLIVDDEVSIRRALSTTLTGMGFDVAIATTGEEAISMARSKPYEVVLLDINMPGMGGVAACRELRNLKPGLAIFMLTVRDSEDDKVQALDAGADDYVTKPFHVRELAARLRSAVRRSVLLPPSADAPITIGDIELDPAHAAVSKNGEPVHLTPKEFELLKHLMLRAGFPVTHARLLSAVWGSEYANQVEYLRTFVRQLRKKLEDDPSNPTYLLTDSHLGYRFREPDKPDSEVVH
jgi:two-component system KDP operon response regulator KdpE